MYDEEINLQTLKFQTCRKDIDLVCLYLEGNQNRWELFNMYVFNVDETFSLFTTFAFIKIIWNQIWLSRIPLSDLTFTFDFGHLRFCKLCIWS